MSLQPLAQPNESILVFTALRPKVSRPECSVKKIMKKLSDVSNQIFIFNSWDQDADPIQKWPCTSQSMQNAFAKRRMRTSTRPYLKQNVVAFKHISVCDIPEVKAAQVLLNCSERQTRCRCRGLAVIDNRRSHAGSLSQAWSSKEKGASLQQNKEQVKNNKFRVSPGGICRDQLSHMLAAAAMAGEHAVGVGFCLP